MSANFKIIFFALMSIMLAACSYNFLPDQNYFERDVSDTFATVLDIIGTDDLSALSEISIPEVRELEGYEASMGELLTLAGDPSGAQLVMAENRTVDGSRDSERVFYGVYEYQNGPKFELLQLALQEVDGECCFLRHVQFNQDDFRRSTYNDFGSQSLNLKRLLFLALMIFTLSFILIVAVLVVRDKGLKRKWLWFFFVLFGTYGATLNWTTVEIAPSFISFTQGGGIHFSLFEFNLLGGSFMRSGLFQPWILEWGFPLGAVIYFIKHKRWRRKKTPDDAEPIELLD